MRPSRYLAELQGVPIFGPADRQQWWVGPGRTLDCALHPLGQVSLQWHGGHVGWICKGTNQMGQVKAHVKWHQLTVAA